MKTSLKAKLAIYIQKFLDENCEHPDWPECYTPESLGDRMTDAAETVFDASVESSVFTEDQS